MRIRNATLFQWAPKRQKLLAENLNEYFSQPLLMEICDELEFPCVDLPETKREFIAELINRLESENRVDELRDRAKQLQPSLTW